MHYLEEQGLGRHNITVRERPPDILNGSDYAAKGTRLNHIVRWVKRYGDDPPETGTHAGTHTLSEVGIARRDHTKTKRETARSAKGHTRDTPVETKIRVRDTFPPPLKGGMNPTPKSHTPKLEANEDDERPIPW